MLVCCLFCCLQFVYRLLDDEEGTFTDESITEYTYPIYGKLSNKTDNIEDGLECDGNPMFDCLTLHQLNDFVLNENGEFNFGDGHWYPIEDDCHNNSPIYIFASNYTWTNELKYYLYRSSYTDYWHIMLNEINDYKSYAVCPEYNVIDCSGNWYSYSGGEDSGSGTMIEESGSIIAYCTESDDFNDKKFLYPYNHTMANNYNITRSFNWASNSTNYSSIYSMIDATSSSDEDGHETVNQMQSRLFC